MTYAKQSTDKTFLLGPILDSAGVAKTDDVVASIKVTKNGTVGAVDAQDTLTHNHTGHYVFVSDGGDFDTLGEVEFSLNSGTNAMAPVKFQVLPGATYDAFVTNAAGAAGGLSLHDTSLKTLMEWGAWPCLATRPSGSTGYVYVYPVITGAVITFLSTDGTTASLAQGATNWELTLGAGTLIGPVIAASPKGDYTLDALTYVVVSMSPASSEAGNALAESAGLQSAAAAALAAIDLDHLIAILQAMARKDTPNVAALAILNAIHDGGSAGTFSATTDSLEGIRDTAPLGTAMRGTDGAYTGTPPTVGQIDTQLSTTHGPGAWGAAAAGAKTKIIECKDTNGDPLVGAQVFSSSDSGFDTVIAGPFISDASGLATCFLPVGAQYIWVLKSGYTINNPTSFTVT